jgi:hypothetical protein
MFTRWVEHHFRDAEQARQTICTISGVLAAVSVVVFFFGLAATH